MKLTDFEPENPSSFWNKKIRLGIFGNLYLGADYIFASGQVPIIKGF